MNGSAKLGSGDKILDAVVIAAAVLLFFKTADVLSLFGPAILSEIVGFDTSLLYGIVCALLVEGLALALHFNRRAALSSMAQTVKWTVLGLSGICQIYDGFITTQSISQLSDTMKAGLAFGVPLIPLLIMFMVFGIGELPEVDGSSTQPKKPFVGLKPMWQRLIHGDTPSTPLPILPQPSEFEIPMERLDTLEKPNPTLGAEK